jgi:SAM-dependent methyltransferase
MYIRNLISDPNIFNDTTDDGYLIDNKFLQCIRSDITEFITTTIKDLHDKRILEIGPREFIANKYISEHNHVDTIDIIDNNITTYVGDMTTTTSIPSATYDVVYCLDVIEHCNNPKGLFEEVARILKPNGILHLSSPFGFRIHGPVPDFWRISHYGLIHLSSITGYKVLSMNAMIDENRAAFPIHYTCSFIKNH